ncbi:LuxR family transcriptional regulator [Nocardioides sp. zg-579]|uniref:LuxR family transcriptional regulator n=1 Tax=Nocardioides marmotae TaxID=2663857 RepID=A0A6I3JDQ7_9ACTN|nr:LuxR family transcriptional regulator [Nocardioides marmotae]MCR6032524.1 LuxR family transcriptional regulator [Gordonia jinghuaiqii]MTB96173.1 LuxR family transcriptional regulator [Nocardioides marmotae]QKD99752.1 LuxR family transcriptional regulator [Nocardioides marmotae]
MAAYDAQDRQLFEKVAAPLYEEMLAGSGLPADDPRLGHDGTDGEPASTVRRALDLLAELGLARLDPETDRWLPEDPTSSVARVVSPLGREGARLLEESAAWSSTLATLGQAWRRTPQAADVGPFTYLRAEAIEPFLAALVAECQEEALTAQPQTGRDPKLLAVGIQRDTALLERGARIRTLYQHSARRSSATREYVAEVTARGAEVRTLDEFFNRMIVIDRRVALIPSGDDLSVALAVREPSVVAYLVDVFERSWARARPFTSRSATMLKDIAAEQRAMTLRMLIEGHPDPVSAKRLGVSPRTYAGYVADLKHEFEAETRFQLGYTIGQRGLSGEE